MVQSPHDDQGGVEPIAIIGLAARVPGARDTGQFWRNLVDGVESVTFFTREKQLAIGATEDQLDDPSWVSAAPVLDDVDTFDADLFGMSGREVELTNPQHRLFLETAHSALEDAGYDPDRYPGDIGVYAGTGVDHYKWLNIYRNPELWETMAGTLAMSNGNLTDYVATLASYKLNLRGPSMTVQTACSTSLVAVHLAVESLRNAECDLALAGGVCVELPHGLGYQGMEGFTSPDGHCRPFDARANGTMWGSGVGVAVFKRLSEAIADGDHIRAVVLGNAVNNDGSNKVGFTAPSAAGQAEVIAQAIGVAAVDPRSISYVEAHGTGTALGDPIEVAGLTAVYGAGATDRNWCGLGSVKSNIGHLSQAAGIIGLIKTVLSLEHGLIPATINLDQPNPAIDLDSGPFYFAAALSKWDSDGTPRRAGVSSFGIGGTNAHIILEEAPQPLTVRPATTRPAHLLQLSARNPEALTAMARRLADHLDEHPDLDLADVAYTLRVGRTPHPHRLAVAVGDLEAATESLRDGAEPAVATDPPRPVAFLFSGQGAQYAGMGAELYRAEPVFARTVDECAALLEPELGRDLRPLMFDVGSEAELRETRHTQPALFVLEYALARLWQHWGVEPVAMIGHSIGEYVAATLAGVFTLGDALRLVTARGRLMQDQPTGSMLAVQLDESEVAPRLPAEVSIATVNGPGTCVVAGPVEAVAAFADTLRAQGIGRKPLRTSHAFHSAMMEPAAAAFAEVVAAVPRSAPRVPFLSNLTGRWITPAEATDPAYWAAHLRQPVRFGAALATLLADGAHTLVECGPGRQLSGLARMQQPRDGSAGVALPSLPGPGDRGGDLARLYATAGRLWTSGTRLDAATFSVPGRRVPLPGYAYQRKRYWIDPAPDSGVAAGPRSGTGRPAAAEPLPLDSWFAVPTWRRLVRPAAAAPPAWDRCLAFVPAGPATDLVTELTAGLRAAGVRVFTVAPGSSFRRDEDGFVIRPGHREDYDALLAALAAEGGVPARVLHAWTLGEPGHSQPTDVGAAQDAGFFSLLDLVQAVAARPDEPAVHLDVVTAGTQDVVGGDLVNPQHATVAGIARVVPLDVRSVSVRHLDVEAGEPDRRSARTLLAELLAEPAEPVLAIRAGRCWVPDHEQLTVPATAGPTPGLREHGVYLVTGGLGGIGITIAEDLAEHCGARLVLLGRSGLPPRTRWDTLPDDGGRTARAVAAIRRIEAAGGEVLVCAADVTDADQLRAVRSEVLARFGRLDGIVHAAGVPGGGMAEVRQRLDAERVLAPKLGGTVALQAAFGDLDLDFVLLCSSVTAVAGGFGQVDYCAANAFLDAYARSDHGWRGRVLSVGWGAWLEVGMAAEATAPEGLRELVAAGRADGSVTPIAHPVLTELHEVPGSLPWCAGTLSSATHWVVDEHRMAGVPVLPGTGHLETARAAIAAALPQPGPDHVVELSDVTFLQPLAVPDGTSARVTVTLTQAPDGVDFEISTGTVLHTRGTGNWVPAGVLPLRDLAGIRDRCTAAEYEVGDGDRAPVGGLLSFGPRWNSLRRVHLGVDEQLALLELPPAADGDLDGYLLHPALLDEATWPSRYQEGELGGDAGSAQYLPLGYGRVVVRGPLPARVWSYRRRRPTASEAVVVADLSLLDDAGRELLSVSDFTLRRVDGDAVGGAVAAQSDPAQLPARPAAVGNSPAAAARTIGIRPRDGAEAMRRLLATDLGPHVVVAATRLQRILDGVQQVTQEAVQERLEIDLADPADSGPGAGTELEQILARVWSNVLGVDGITPADDFFELGGNSLVAVQLIAQVRKAVGVKLPMRSLFEVSTVSGMAEQIERMRDAQPPPATPPTPGTAEPTRQPPPNSAGSPTIPRLRRDP